MSKSAVDPVGPVDPVDPVDPVISSIAEARRVRRSRRALALGLMLLAPLCAEYLTGYDSSTGDPLALTAGLLVFAPLYGAPALLLREIARRHGVRWPGILALACALGIVQAGLVDQSLFSDSYRDIAYWDDMLLPTLVQPLGLAAYPTMVFIVGHLVWSFSVPIALVEALRPAHAAHPWLGRPGLVIVTLLYLAACGLVLVDHLQHEADHASAAQLGGSVVAVGLLVGFACTVGRRRGPTRGNTPLPSPMVLGATCLAAAVGFNLVPENWWGVAAGSTVLVAVGGWLTRLAGSDRWATSHVVAVASGALLARAAVAFLVVPLGTVAPAAKYAHNVVFLVGAAGLAGWAMNRTRRPADRLESDRRSAAQA